MIYLLDSILSFICYTLVPFLLYCGVIFFAIAAIKQLGCAKAGYSRLQAAGSYFTMSAVCYCYHIGYEAGLGYSDPSFFGYMWVIITSVIAAFLIAMCRAIFIPTLLIAAIFWGFIITPWEKTKAELEQKSQEIKYQHIED